MGNLLKLLSRDENCCSYPKNDIFVDFESAAPTPDEVEIYQEADIILAESKEIISELSNYEGASKEIREAITNPSPENEALAWKTVLPLVQKLNNLYDFSVKVEKIVLRILSDLCRGQVAGSVAEQLDVHQALVKQFAKLLEFVLKFDEEKMLKSVLQNDFSYYRRTVQRNRTSGIAATSSSYEIEQPFPISVANSMSLFFAQATPMLFAVSGAVSKFVVDEKIDNEVTAMLSMMAKVCQKMLEIPELRSRLQYKETELFILRVMVAIVILYDHVHPTGAFAKGTHVDVKGCIKVLREHNKTSAENLLNALRYTTKHLNDESTPKSLKSLIFEDIS